MVPSRWRDGTVAAGPDVGAVPVLHRTGGDCGAARRWSRRAADRRGAGSFALDGLARAAPQRSHSWWATGLPGLGGTVALRAACPPPQAHQARRPRRAARIRPGPAVRAGRPAGRHDSHGSDGPVDRAPARATSPDSRSWTYSRSASWSASLV